MNAYPRTQGLSRRGFLAAAGVGVVGLGSSSKPASASPSPTPHRTVGPKLGIASYSLRNFSRAYVIDAVRSLGTPYVNLKSFHQPYEDTPEQLAAGRRAFESAGLMIAGGGTITLQTDTEEDIRSYFEYAKASGMRLMVIAPTEATLPRIERFVIEYDIEAAIHNHGPEDEHFPGPQDILPVIKDMDSRVGVCLDVGHTARTGINVAEAAELCGPRLLDVHMKDLADLNDRGSQCIVGDGSVPVSHFFRALDNIGYERFVNLEYEIDPLDPLPGMALSLAFMRGVAATIPV